MSLPFYKITCSGCDYDSTHSHNVRYEYEGKKEHKPVFDTAWCEDCNEVVNMCSSLTRKQADDEIKELSEWIEEKKKGFFAKWSKTKKDSIAYMENSMELAKQRINYFENTAQVKKCLCCGGQRITPIQLPYNYSDKPINANITHSCGGDLLISMKGFISLKILPRVVYDETGAILLDERKQREENI